MISHHAASFLDCRKNLLSSRVKCRTNYCVACGKLVIKCIQIFSYLHCQNTKRCAIVPSRVTCMLCRNSLWRLSCNASLRTLSLYFSLEYSNSVPDVEGVCGRFYLKATVQRFWNRSAVRYRELKKTIFRVNFKCYEKEPKCSQTLVLRELKFGMNLFRDLAAIHYY